MTAAKSLASILETFLALWVLFAVHRVLSLGPLSSTELTPFLATQALIVGFLSDMWVAFLLSMIVGGLTAVVAVLGAPMTARVIRLVIAGGIAVLTACHQGYIDFYRAQITPFHLRYLLDVDFLVANGGAAFALKPFVEFGAWLTCLLGLTKLDVFAGTSTKKLSIATLGLTVLALGAHNRNIHWRTQWFVQDSLQVNGFERIYLNVKYASTPDPLSEDELDTLARTVGAEPKASLRDILTTPAQPPRGMTPLGAALDAAVRQAQENKERPLILVAMMESLRPAETGYFAPSYPSLTPHLDDLIKKGIVFKRAFSSGSVTRGGQEAVFCGHLGSRETSLMRGHAAANVRCLPEVWATGTPSVETFWFHGGEGRFDNQLAYWTDHAVPHTMSLKDFPEDAPRTGWGVGDVTFFRAAATRLIELHRASTADLVAGMTLSVSNHIPWTVPGDAPELDLGGDLSHPSQATTLYADYALNEFVVRLKDSGLWDKTMLIVASDHGNNVEPYVDLYGQAPDKAQLLQSHVNFALVGGLVERALLAASHVPQAVEERVVSQASVAALLATTTLRGDVRFMADHPFASQPFVPVVSILEEDLYVPAANASRRLNPAARASKDAPPSLIGPLLYFRGFLEYINTWSSDVAAPGP